MRMPWQKRHKEAYLQFLENSQLQRGTGKAMIDRKYHRIVFSFFMALLMSCIMSFVISVFNVGLVSNIIHIWLRAWAFAFAVAFPTITIISPLVHKLVSLVLKEEKQGV